MSEQLASRVFRGAVVMLLLVIAILEWKQTEELRELSYATKVSSDVLNVRVVNKDEDKIPISGAVQIDTSSKYSTNIPIPVRITNNGLIQAVPVLNALP